MRYYPVFLDIQGRPCLVVGGGEVAERKVISLVSSGGAVTVISPELTPVIAALAEKGAIKAKNRGFRAGDTKGFFLAVSAVNDRDVNEAVYSEASARGIPVNVVDDPERCSFIVPSVVDRGGLIIAISTSGKAPFLSKTIRLELEKRFGPEYAQFVELLGAARLKMLNEGLKHGKKDKAIKSLVNSPIPRWIKDGSPGDIDRLLAETLGDGYSLIELGIKLKGRRGTKKAPKHKKR